LNHTLKPQSLVLGQYHFLFLFPSTVVFETSLIVPCLVSIRYDRSLGGLDMQLRLRDYLGQKFNDAKKTPNDIFKNPRALAKLFKEAGRVKNVLSANVDHFAQVCSGFKLMSIVC